MKISQIKQRVAAKVAKGKAKVAKKCGKAAKCAAVALLLSSACCLIGCATADAPTAQRAQNVKAENVQVTYNISVPALASNICERIASQAPVNFTFSTEVATAAQANETSGAETMTNTPTQTPTTDVKTDLKFTYGLASDTASGTSWLNSLTDASAKGLASWLKSGRANGTMCVTKSDGSTECVTCKDGTCTNSAGDCITCKE